MSVTEKAELIIAEGRAAEFEALLPKALAIVRGVPGCSSVSVSRGIEKPDVFLLLVEWDSVDVHVEFTKTPAFGEFVGLVKEFFAGPTGMAHWTPLNI